MTSVPASIYEIEVLNVRKEPVQLSKYQGKVLLIVNGALKCGFTPHYKSLQGIYEKYNDKGLEILAFPSNDFNQELNDEEVIEKEMCTTYTVTYPIFAKIGVKMDRTNKEDIPTSPLYKFLISNYKGDKDGKKTGDVEWNFEKFVVDRKGEVTGRYRRAELPDENKDDDPLFNALKS